MAAALLCGCAQSDFTYVRDDDGATYFKVPSGWRKVDQKSLDSRIFGDLESAAAQAQKQASWTVAFDAHTRPSADHLLIGATGAEDQPFVVAKVQKLSESEQNQVSLNVLRNSIGLPVAVPDTLRQQLEADAANPFKQFELLADQVLPAHDGIRGVRSVFNFRLLNGPVQTFDETAYLSADGSHISTLLIRCSATCYRKRAGEINVIAQSFKVKRLLNQ
ncbi:hypothetical protein N5079_03970 [Planotetraspora sp. A-T 1434]|uniref:hypothetical protein n=1 Tax=Planotetraspora sp. A-T 1434 TaxID=2979219 RepID=UPI0021BECF1A|nr:hypothetical protein [Planotetraspora sp. A-T 1434]MCT9929371.1 hypothetical protein [Planotetraspora sp. A-T 1434]